MDPALLVVAAVLSLPLGEGARALAAVRTGDDTPARAGRLRALHRNVETLGTVLVPGLLALVSGAAFGWATRVPVTLGERTRSSRLVVAAAAPLMHLVLAVAAVQVWSLTPVEPAWPGELALAVHVVNWGTAVFLLLPLPPLAGGEVVAALLPTGSAAQRRWARWQRHAVAPYGLVVAAIAVATGLLEAALPVVTTGAAAELVPLLEQ